MLFRSGTCEVILSGTQNFDLQPRFLCTGCRAWTLVGASPSPRRRREGTLVRDCFASPCSGVILAPGGSSRTQSLRQRTLRRENGAGGPTSEEIPAITHPPAPKRRRDRCSRRDFVRVAPSGAEVAPEGGLSQYGRKQLRPAPASKPIYTQRSAQRGFEYALANDLTHEQQPCHWRTA